MNSDQVLRTIALHEKGFINDFEMWREIAEIADWALNDIDNGR